MDVPWPIYIILSPAIFFALFGISVRPFRAEHVTGPFIQGGLVGILASIAWWLAGVASDSSGISRYLLDGLVGILALSALWQLFMVAMLVKSIRHDQS